MRLLKITLGLIWIGGIFALIVLPLVIHWFAFVTLASLPFIIAYGSKINDWLTEDFN